MCIYIFIYSKYIHYINVYLYITYYIQLHTHIYVCILQQLTNISDTAYLQIVNLGGLLVSSALKKIYHYHSLT